MTFLYLIHSPRRVKIGITWHLGHRLSNIDKTTAGKQRLILAVLLPWGARQVEAWLHRRYRRYHSPLRVGSGRTEYFRGGFWVLECAFLMVAGCLLRWGVVLGGFYLILLILVR